MRDGRRCGVLLFGNSFRKIVAGNGLRRGRRNVIATFISEHSGVMSEDRALLRIQAALDKQSTNKRRMCSVPETLRMESGGCYAELVQEEACSIRAPPTLMQSVTPAKRRQNAEKRRGNHPAANDMNNPGHNR